MTERERDAELLAAARAAAAAGDVEAAREMATEVLRGDPTSEEAQSLVGLTRAEAGELRLVTILFCDLIGSTQLSARLDLSRYRGLLRRYQELVDDEIAAWGGQVNRRIGDGIMALFGHPRTHEDDTARAVHAGLAIARRVAALRESDTEDRDELFDVRIAVHVGLVHLDLSGSDVYGLAPNLAARLQDLAPPGRLVVSDEVLEVVGDAFETTAGLPQPVKGLDRRVTLHVVEGARDPSGRRGRAWRSPFVGRGAEISRLAGHLVDDGARVVVTGEAGMGKSRLAAEAIAAVEREVGPTLEVVCTQMASTTAFEAASALLRIRPGTHLDPDPARRLATLREDLARLEVDEGLVGLLAPVLHIDPAAGYEPAATDPTKISGEIRAAFRTVLAALGARRPTLVLVEDLQWADAATRDVVDDLLRDPLPGIRLLITTRPDPPEVPDDVLTVALAPLDPADATELARRLAPTLAEVAIDTAVERAQGVPLYLEELVRHALGGADLRPGAVESSLPAALAEALLARLHGPGVDVGLAQVAATLGRGFDVDTLAEVANRSPALFDAGVDRLVDEAILDPDPHDGLYWFRHSLIRDVAYETQTADDRLRRHGRIGLALRRRRLDGAPVPWGVIAEHLERGAHLGEAVEAHDLAADEATARGALVEAKDHLAGAIGLVRGWTDATPPPRDEVGLRLRRGALGVATGGNADPDSVEDYDVIWQLVRESPRPEEHIGALTALMGYHAATGNLRWAEELVDRIWELGEPDDDPQFEMENRAGRGLVLLYLGEVTRADTELEAGMARFDALRTAGEVPSRWDFPNDPPSLLAIHSGMARWLSGDPDTFEERVALGRERASTLAFPDGPFSLAYVRSYESWVRAEMGEFDEALDAAGEVQAIAARHGFDFWAVAGMIADAVARGRRELARPDPDREVLAAQAAALGSAVTISEMAAARAFLPYCLTALADLATGAGDPDAAEAHLARAIEIETLTGSCFYAAETRRVRACLRRDGDEHRLGDLREAAAISAHQKALPYELRALVDLAALGVEDPRLAELRAMPGVVRAAGRGREPELTAP